MIIKDWGSSDDYIKDWGSSDDYWGKDLGK